MTGERVSIVRCVNVRSDLCPEIVMFLKKIHFFKSVGLPRKIGQPVVEPCMSQTRIHCFELYHYSKKSISILLCLSCSMKHEHSIGNNIKDCPNITMLDCILELAKIQAITIEE